MVVNCSNFYLLLLLYFSPFFLVMPMNKAFFGFFCFYFF